MIEIIVKEDNHKIYHRRSFKLSKAFEYLQEKFQYLEQKVEEIRKKDD